MASDDGDPENFLQNNQVLDAVDGSIKHILLKISSITQQQAIEELTSDEDETLVQETRNIVFKEALASYSRSYERAKGTSLDVGKVEMKQRKGENKLSRSAKDIVELYLYFVNLMPEFPREIIKSNGSYFDIFPADVITVHSSQTAGSSKPNHDQSVLNSVNNDVHEKSGDPQDMGSHSRAELESLLREALQEKEDMQREMSNMRAHLLSVEKILFDELRGVRLIAERNSADIRSIKKDPSHQRATKHSPSQQHSMPQANQAAEAAARSLQAERNPPAPEPGAGSEGDRSGRTPSSPPDDASQKSDPSLSQLLASDSEDDAESVASVEVDQTGDKPDKYTDQTGDKNFHDPTIFRGPSANNAPHGVDAATSPNFVRFDSNKSSSNIKKRPMQKSVNNMSDGQNDNQWTKVEHRKNKGNDKNKMGQLKGRPLEQFTDLYVSGIAKEDGESSQDIADEVRAYCKSKNLRIMSVWVLPNRVSHDTVGCKLRVPTVQVDHMLGNRMWPEGLVCKRWRSNPRPDHASQGGASEGLSGRGRSRSRSRNDTRQQWHRSRSNNNRSRSRSSIHSTRS